MPKRHPRHRPVRAFGERRQHDDRCLNVAMQIVVPQPLEDGGDLAFKRRHILIAQVAVAGDADHQRQAVG
jgi:hypothetical protein